MADGKLMFSGEEYAARLTSLRSRMAAKNLDALLFVAPQNIFYFSGYYSMEGAHPFLMLGVPLEGQPFLLLRAINGPLARHCSWIEDISLCEDGEDPVAVTVDALRNRGLLARRIGIEERSPYLPAQLWRKLNAVIGNLVDGSGVAEPGRMVKSPQELAYMREAARMTDLGMQAAYAEMQAGRSDNDVAAAAFDAMTRAGSEFMTLDPVVVTGPESSLLHATYRRRKIESGHSVFCELAAVYNRFCAPLIRTAFVDKPPAELEHLSEVAAEAVAAAAAKMRPGATAGEVDAAYRAVLMREGQDYRKGGMGYSVGIGFSCFPEKDVALLLSGSTLELVPGMCFFAYSILRLPGKGVAGASDLFVVTNDGVEVLSKVPREVFRS